MFKGQAAVVLMEPPTPARGDGGTELVGAPARDQLSGEDARMFDALRALRLRIARERDVPPYVIFHDSVLRELARVRPRTLQQLGKIKGVGERKLAEFGPVFLEEIGAREG